MRDALVLIRLTGCVGIGAGIGICVMFPQALAEMLLSVGMFVSATEQNKFATANISATQHAVIINMYILQPIHTVLRLS